MTKQYRKILWAAFAALAPALLVSHVTKKQHTSIGSVETLQNADQEKSITELLKEKKALKREIRVASGRMCV